MSTGLKILLGLLVTGALFAVITVTSVIGINNNLVGIEAGIKAQYKQNQNNYDNFIKKVQETAQVPDMQRDDLEKLYKTAMTARYGSNGSKAMFQWLKEQNPTLDSAVYVQLQSIIDAGRTSFEADQKMLLDKKRVYEIELGVFPNNFIASFLGFPKLDLSKYDIVTSTETEEAFETKKSKPLQLRPTGN